jgi:hypothetical protein
LPLGRDPAGRNCPRARCSGHGARQMSAVARVTPAYGAPVHEIGVAVLAYPCGGIARLPGRRISIRRWARRCSGGAQQRFAATHGCAGDDVALTACRRFAEPDRDAQGSGSALTSGQLLRPVSVADKGGLTNPYGPSRAGRSSSAQVMEPPRLTSRSSTKNEAELAVTGLGAVIPRPVFPAALFLEFRRVILPANVGEVNARRRQFQAHFVHGRGDDL